VLVRNPVGPADGQVHGGVVSRRPKRKRSVRGAASCVACRAMFRLPEVAVIAQQLVGPVHVDCLRFYLRHRGRYVATETMATGYPLRYEVRS
jgi:hypothetical protein